MPPRQPAARGPVVSARQHRDDAMDQGDDLEASPVRGSPQQQEQAEEAGVERGAGVPDKPARQPRKKDPKLDLDLLEANGGFNDVWHTIAPAFKASFQGEGHEVADLRRLLELYQRWQMRFYPHCDFDTFVTKLEKSGRSRAIKSKMHSMRQNLLGLIFPDEEPAAATAGAPADLQPAAGANTNAAAATAFQASHASAMCGLHGACNSSRAATTGAAGAAAAGGDDLDDELVAMQREAEWEAALAAMDALEATKAAGGTTQPAAAAAAPAAADVDVDMDELMALAEEQHHQHQQQAAAAVAAARPEEDALDAELYALAMEHEAAAPGPQQQQQQQQLAEGPQGAATTAAGVSAAADAEAEAEADLDAELMALAQMDVAPPAGAAAAVELQAAGGADAEGGAAAMEVDAAAGAAAAGASQEDAELDAELLALANAEFSLPAAAAVTMTVTASVVCASNAPEASVVVGGSAAAAGGLEGSEAASGVADCAGGSQVLGTAGGSVAQPGLGLAGDSQLEQEGEGSGSQAAGVVLGILMTQTQQDI
eukprot:XP_001690884.1 predicted protein [Chlamydomonas reinhardtii]